MLAEAKRQELAVTYQRLNPVLLLKQINGNLECLWRLAERPTPKQEQVKTYTVSVTVLFDATRTRQTQEYLAN